MLFISNGHPFSINGGSFNIQPDQFTFTITSVSNQTVVVEDCTNMASPVWTRLATNNVTAGASHFSDPQRTNYPRRFYRLSSP